MKELFPPLLKKLGFGSESMKKRFIWREGEGLLIDLIDLIAP